MGYRIPAHLAFCTFDNSVIFLDVRKDRYFALPKLGRDALSRTLASQYLAEADVPVASRLMTKGILETCSSDEVSPPITIARPRVSLVEIGSTGYSLNISHVCDVGYSVGKIWASLRMRPFHSIVGAVSKRRRSIEELGGRTSHSDRHEMLASRFVRSRTMIPAKPVCLLDSLSLIDFLARHGVTADLVIGVTENPFSAHCWVQTDEALLNESIHRAREFTPILVL